MEIDEELKKSFIVVGLLVFGMFTGYYFIGVLVLTGLASWLASHDIIAVYKFIRGYIRS